MADGKEKRPPQDGGLKPPLH